MSASEEATVPAGEMPSDDVFSAEGAAAWELSKENVIPLRSGRRVASLNEAVARDSLTQDARLREERHQFESELRAIDPKKPDNSRLLDVWHRYVTWTEQSFASGKELPEILQRSLQAFPRESGDMAEVAEDPKYVDLWMKMADAREDPLEIFAFMYSKKIGKTVAAFYERWAFYLEDEGNFKKASAVLLKGISNEAAPMEHLSKLKADLEIRVARGLRKGVADMAIDEDDGGMLRATLGELRGVGKHKAAPNVRVGPQAQKPSARRGMNFASNAKTSSSSTPNVPSSSSFRIFSDDNSYQDSLTENPYNANPMSAGRAKENVQKPVAWNKVKAKQKASTLPSTPITPCFDIHVDDDAMLPPPDTPAKTIIDMTHSRPLSTKKMPKEPMKPLEFLEAPPAEDKERLMFRRDKVYQGLEEFSFEEIRAEMWKRKADMVPS